MHTRFDTRQMTAMALDLHLPVGAIGAITTSRNNKSGGKATGNLVQSVQPLDRAFPFDLVKEYRIWSMPPLVMK